MTEPVGPTNWRRMRSSPWFHLAVATIVVILLQLFVVKVYQVPSTSMAPTLTPGDRILVNRLAAGSAAIGDVIVFKAGKGWPPSDGHTLVKRIVAGPGTTFSCCDRHGNDLLDGVAQTSGNTHNNFPFAVGTLDCATEPKSLRCLPPYRVPNDSYVVLGDNRLVSDDSYGQCRGKTVELSSCIKLVAADDIVGTVWLRIWPLNNWGGV